MDGLLVDTEPLWFEVEAAVMARLGGSWTHEDQKRCLGGSLEQSSRYMLAAASSRLPWPTVAGWLVEGMSELLPGRVHPRPGALALLAELADAGVPRALVSSSQRGIVDAVLASIGSGHFAFSVSGDDVTRLKPDPEPYLTAVRRLGATASRCVVLEDSATGVAAARAAGCVVVAVPSVAPIPATAGCVVMSSLEQANLRRLAAIVAESRRDGIAMYVPSDRPGR